MPDRLSSDRDQVLDDSIERRHCQRQMTLIAVQVDPCIRNVFREPLSVREGHHPILLALPHRHRWLDLREVESQSRTNARSSSRQPASPLRIGSSRLVKNLVCDGRLDDSLTTTVLSHAPGRANVDHALVAEPSFYPILP